MAKNVVVLVLVGVVIWFGSAVMRLENQNYALRLGICPQFQPEDPSTVRAMYECLETAETRSSAWWSLYYGLGF